MYHRSEFHFNHRPDPDGLRELKDFDPQAKGESQFGFSLDWVPTFLVVPRNTNSRTTIFWAPRLRASIRATCCSEAVISRLELLGPPYQKQQTLIHILVTLLLWLCAKRPGTKPGSRSVCHNFFYVGKGARCKTLKPSHAGFRRCFQLRTSPQKETQLKSLNQKLMWVWLKVKQQGLRRCWSMFPLTRVPLWYRFLSHSHV